LRRLAIVSLALALALTGLAARAGAKTLAPPADPPWQPLEFPNIERHTRYQSTLADGVRAVRAESNCAASALILPLTGTDLKATPRLRWRWKVERGLEVSDERVKKGDDFAARVYVTFRFDPARATLYERARQRIGTALYGDDLPGTAINYVWSAREPAGAAWDNPFAPSNKMVSRGNGPLADWRVEEVDLHADYVRLFGFEPPPVLFLALMTDADNSCQTAVALYADFELY
jgi:hypothetical protein